MLSKFILNKTNKYIDINKDNVSIVEPTNSINIQSLPNNLNLPCIINWGIVNNIRRINKFHEAVNEKLENGGIYISCGETNFERNNRIRGKTRFGLVKILLVKVSEVSLPTKVSVDGGKVRVTSPVEEGPINVALLVPLLLSS